MLLREITETKGERCNRVIRSNIIDVTFCAFCISRAFCTSHSRSTHERTYAQMDGQPQNITPHRKGGGITKETNAEIGRCLDIVSSCVNILYHLQMQNLRSSGCVSMMQSDWPSYALMRLISPLSRLVVVVGSTITVASNVAPRDVVSTTTCWYLTVDGCAPVKLDNRRP